MTFRLWKAEALLRIQRVEISCWLHGAVMGSYGRDQNELTVNAENC